MSGAELSRAFFDQVVGPLLGERFPGLPLAAGRLGSGSDVLGLDDDVSRDHDWGLRLSLFVPPDAIDEVDRELDERLPESFRGSPVRFAFTGATESRHHVEIGSVRDFVESRLGFDPRAGVSVTDWLSISGQAVLEVTAGPVFADTAGELTAARRALAWYPDDLWRYVIACDWVRIEQELPLVGRAADTGDDLGSRVIASRLVHTIMHLGFLLERRWPPYAKWVGTLFGALECADEVRPALEAVLRASTPTERHRGITAALESMNRRQTALGLSGASPATIPFWDRPHLQPNPEIVAQLTDGIRAEEVRRLPRGRGSVEQCTDNVDVLVDPVARRAVVSG